MCKDIYLRIDKEELQAISDLLHGRHQIRMNPDETWTALKLMELRSHVDAELALANATPFIIVDVRKSNEIQM